jgi:hypothetical protein
MSFARFLPAAWCLATAALAQIARPGGITTLTLGADVANGIVAPAPGSRVRVPPLERVTLLVPEGWSYSIQWTKDGKAIPGATGRSYLIPLATTADSGTYHVAGAPFPFITTGIALEVVPAGHLGNFSTRLELAAGAGGTQTIGFVVGGTSPKNLLVRAVGPSLKQFGLTKLAAQPRLRFFDSAGREFGFVHPAIVMDFEAFFASVGAFPLLAGERDAFDYGAFKPGACTIQVSDAAGLGGTVLVETYEYTTAPAPAMAGLDPVTPPSVRPGG